MESSKLIKVKTYIVSRSVVTFIQLLNIITINQRAFFCHQILLQCVDFFSLGYSPLLCHFCSFFFKSPTLSFSSECSPNRRAFVLPLFLFLFVRLLPELLPRYSGCFILSVVQTYFRTHRHSSHPRPTAPPSTPRFVLCSINQLADPCL